MPQASSRATRVGLALFTYDFAVDAGAQGAIVIGANRLPSGAVIMDGMIFVETACTSGGSATVAIHVQVAEDILAATAVASLTLDALLDTVAVGSAATAIKCTAARGLTFTIATADLTAGVITVALRYMDME